MLRTQRVALGCATVGLLLAAAVVAWIGALRVVPGALGSVLFGLACMFAWSAFASARLDRWTAGRPALRHGASILLSWTAVVIPVLAAGLFNIRVGANLGVLDLLLKPAEVGEAVVDFIGKPLYFILPVAAVPATLLGLAHRLLTDRA